MAMKKKAKAPAMQTSMGSQMPASNQGSNFSVCPRQALNDYNGCLEWGRGFENQMMPIRESNEMIKTELSQVRTQGATALGPGALTAVGLAIGNDPQGSQIILCTDGMANVGLGNFNSADKLGAAQFYQDVGTLASEYGVSINLITFKGDEANIEALQAMCDVSGGEVEIMDIGNAGDMIGNLFDRRTIAVNVEAQVKLHKALEFRNESARLMSHNRKTLVKKLRNVDEDTEFTFEYRLRSLDELVEMEDIDMNTISKFLF